MPVEACTLDGKPGYRGGPSLKCYTYQPGNDTARREAKRKAHVQLAVVEAQTGERAFEDIEARLLDPQFWEDEVRPLIMARVLPRFREAFMVGAELGAEQRPSRARREPSQFGVLAGLRQVLPFDFEAVSAAADEAIATYADTWWRQFSASTQRGLRRAIQRAREQGLGPDAVATEITPLFGEQRARTIAVSEMTTIIGQGAQATYRRAGFPEYEWRTVRDSRVDPICQELDRQRFPIDVPFERAHVGCRCFISPAGDPSPDAARAAVAAPAFTGLLPA